MVFTLHKFKHYLLGNKFVFYVNDIVLVYFLNKLQVSSCIVGRLLLFLNYEFTIIHKPGHTHVVVNTLYKLNKSCPLLVQILFFGWIQSFEQWNLSKGLSVVSCGSIKTLYVICRGVKIWAPSTWDVEANFLSIEGFDISMATFSVHPSRIWVGTSMSFSGGRTSPPLRGNKAFTRGCAFEHITIPTRPLPSYQ
jgi:hypothetical protein